MLIQFWFVGFRINWSFQPNNLPIKLSIGRINFYVSILVFVQPNACQIICNPCRWSKTGYCKKKKNETDHSFYFTRSYTTEAFKATRRWRYFSIGITTPKYRMTAKTKELNTHVMPNHFIFSTCVKKYCRQRNMMKWWPM